MSARILLYAIIYIVCAVESQSFSYNEFATALFFFLMLIGIRYIGV